MFKLKFVLILQVTLGLLVVSPRAIPAQSSEVSNLQERMVEVIDRCLPAVVEIHRRGAVFSGVIVSPKGHVLTAGHTVVPGQRYTVELPDGQRLTGHALGSCEQMRGERIDCGLIRITHPVDLPYIQLGSSSKLQAGQPCMSISYPGGQRASNEPIVRLGFVQRPPRAGRMLQSTALMEPGDSGGPLIDLSGKVIAIHSRIGTGMEQNYDVPINTFKTYWDALNVVQQFSASGGLVVPRLGFVGQDTPDGDGIAILSVAEGGIAQQIGLQADDVLMRIQNQILTGMRDLQPHLLSAIESEPLQVALAVRRGQEEREYILPGERLTLPLAERIPGLDNESDGLEPAEDLLIELSGDLDSRRAELSKQLSDTCCLITSHIDGKPIQSVAMRIAGSNYLVSKSSLVGLVPFSGEKDQLVELSIIARDPELDLILLRAQQKNVTGVSVPLEPSDPNIGTAVTSVRTGLLAYSPTPGTQGLVSMVGSSEFTSPRQESRGYLGVVLRDNEDRGVVLMEVDDGAAQRAGLRPGDIILSMNEQIIGNRSDILRLLRSLDPNMTVKAQVLRDSQQFEASITLGSRPDESDHAADMMNKSLRRDGFERVFCHDATLLPEMCGGPLFDLEGNWIGLNIARYSRVRTFALPAAAVAEFVRLNQEN